jgi:hypothetical protein
MSGVGLVGFEENINVKAEESRNGDEQLNYCLIG